MPRPDDQIQAEIGQLRSDVERQTSLEQSVTVLFDGLDRQLQKIGSSAQDVQDARNQLDQLRNRLVTERASLTQALQANVAPLQANTPPQAPAPTTTPTVTVEGSRGERLVMPQSEAPAPGEPVPLEQRMGIDTRRETTTERLGLGRGVDNTPVPAAPGEPAADSLPQDFGNSSSSASRSRKE